MAGRVLIVEARFYGDIADDLVRGAAAVLEEAEIGHSRLAVPGVFEVPGALRLVLASDADTYAGYLALGCVIRGETDHYDHICREASRALMDITLDGVALGFGILTCATYEQAAARAAPDGRNKGAEAAKACLGMMAISQNLRDGQGI